MEVVNILLSSILGAISPQINVRLVIVVLAGCIGASVGLVFMWWGIRKLTFIMMTSFRSGGLSVSGSGDKSSGQDRERNYDAWVDDRLAFIDDLKKSL